LFASALWGETSPSLKILLPHKTRLLVNQQVDLELEVLNAKNITDLQVMAGSTDITKNFRNEYRPNLDCTGGSDWVIRADMQTFNTAGGVKLTVSLRADGTPLTGSREIEVRPFHLPAGGSRRNIILFIGDAMGTAYRDAGRLVGRAIIDPTDGRDSFNQGFFDDLQEMDKMPISGMSMTYGSDAVVPDSANTAAEWASGNKTFNGALNVFSDSDDCNWRFNGMVNTSTEPYILDNPRVETLWQYLKRLYGYRTGIVSTADITDAAPAAEGSYTASRQARAWISMSYLKNPLLFGYPAFDVIMGGGLDQFIPAGRTDHKDLIAGFRALGFKVVHNASDLEGVSGPTRVLGLFRGNPNPSPNSSGLAAFDSNMTVLYDKLGLPRPASENPIPNPEGDFTDQPQLDLMTQKAIEVLSAAPSPGFILMVEGASIDKESHANNAAGEIWDTLELDRAVGVARKWAAARNPNDSLVLVTADHDQSMVVMGVSNIPDENYFDQQTSTPASWTTAAGDQMFTVFEDSYSNTRAGLPFINSSGNGNWNASRVNAGAKYMPGPFRPDEANQFFGTFEDAPDGALDDPVAMYEAPVDTYSPYSGFTGYYVDPKTGYPTNQAPSGQTLRRLAVGFRTGDHAGSSVPITAEGTGAFLFTGYMDETDIFFKMAVAATGDTKEGDNFVKDVLMSGRYPKTPGK
jgi:alkaline phosphatase